MIRTVFYYASWTILICFLLIMVVGSVAKNGVGPLVLGVVLVGAVFGIINGKDDES